MSHLKISEQITRIFNDWMEGEGRWFLYLPSLLYGIGLRLRFLLYCIGVFKTHRLDCKVISIGNITTGGSGKTPMAIYLAERLLERGKKVIILSRGYKGKIKDVGVVSDGENILLGPEDAGDEPYLMAVKLKTVPVIVGRDRYRAGMYAVERFKPDIIILDDGFQHIRLARDMDIALIDSRRGFGNHRLFPMGILREPLSGLNRASFFMVKGNELQIANCKLQIANLKKQNKPIISFNYKPQAVINLLDNSRHNVDTLKGKKVVALSGIAEPRSFSETLKELGAIIIKEIIYPDHHFYTLDDLKKIKDAAAEAEIIVTTEKDGVKLKRLSIKDLPLYTIAVDVNIKNTKDFNEILVNV
ncbi:MAG: tetraacyldisaccharide 4'-kinase [Deltaproteobacteria bacterium]|nr:tetraacyldisaccharide 4'-kinase [Deltaproteobacteria bacterium]